MTSIKIWRAICYHCRTWIQYLDFSYDEKSRLYFKTAYIKLFDQLKYKHIGTVQWDLYELSRDTQCGIPKSHFMHDS